MTKEQFIRKAKEMGYSDDSICESIRLHDEAQKEGIVIPFELSLVDLPIER